MPEKAITDKIDFNKSEQYILSIRLSTDGFSFSIYNPIRDCFVLTRQRDIEAGLSITANIKQAFKELDFLSYTYKQVNVSLVSKRFTLIPLELFAEDQVNTYFYYNFSLKENEVILHDILSKNGTVILYALDRSLYDFLQERYTQIQYYSSITSLAEHFAVKSRLGSDKKMYVYLRKEYMEVYVYERGHLMLLNAYDCKNDSDRAYYLLYAWKQFAMNQLVDELYIMGDGENAGKLIEEMRRFVQHISTLSLIPELIS
ncbi:DUF3822 family protein [Bacteroides sp. 51]|uniref:DUF3822 family protein n=1 Tax=Bacteroides sp. 51 TaxID=2302938 RepID=UPI0013D04D4E|nr:DUF3822 family protein [Bacteroides sp. 51]NDV81800.1 DUF3822 family protein [Bacteroides sp. 51]